MHVRLTLHRHDIEHDDHLGPMVVLFDDELEQSLERWVGEDAVFSLEPYTPPNRTPRPSALMAWTDDSGVRHARQLDVAPGVNVFDFGRYRAVVTA